MVAIVLLFLTSLFKYTPLCTLGGIVIAAALSLISLAEPKRLWRTDEKGDLLILVLTFLVTIFLGPVIGVAAAIGLSLVEFIYRAACPSCTELGKIPGTVVYKDIRSYPTAVTYPQLVIVKLDARLAFYSINWFKRRLEKYVNLRPPGTVKCVVLDCSGISYIDSTAMHTLDSLITEFKIRKITVAFCDMKSALLDGLTRFKLTEKIEQRNIYPTVHSAVQIQLALAEKPEHADDYFTAPVTFTTQLGHAGLNSNVELSDLRARGQHQGRLKGFLEWISTIGRSYETV